ncbi:MAG: ribonuclease Z [Bacteroidia bacterium]
MNPELYILGSSSATPTRERHPSAQLLKLENEKIIIDCGEGTQSQFLRYGLRHTSVNIICISHLHGDHYFGLIGLISTMSLMGRVNPLQIIGPPGLKEILELQISHGGLALKFKLEFITTSSDKFEFILKTPLFEISSFPLKHRIHCAGFLIKETNKEKHLNMEVISKLNIPFKFYKDIKAGEDYISSDGVRIENNKLTFDPEMPKTYAYCSDTIYDESIVQYIKNATVLYHEATFLKNLEDRAALYYHSTAEQAAKIAKSANVGQLLIGHFSSRYDHLKPLLDEAREIFQHTQLALEGEKFFIENLSDPK